MPDQPWGMQIDLTRPIYAQIVGTLVGRIARGEIAPGDGLPSVRSLAQALRVNPNTVQRAYRDMEAMGLTASHPGLGTFVRADSKALAQVRDGMARQIVDRAVEQLRALGLDAAAVHDALAAVLLSEERQP